MNNCIAQMDRWDAADIFEQFAHGELVCQRRHPDIIDRIGMQIKVYTT